MLLHDRSLARNLLVHSQSTPPLFSKHDIAGDNRRADNICIYDEDRGQASAERKEGRIRCEKTVLVVFLREYEVPVQYLCKRREGAGEVGAPKYSRVRAHAAATGELRT